MLIYYQRNLPHRLPPGETIFVTFRLAGSLPLEMMTALQQEFAAVPGADDEAATYARQRRYFGKFDAQLDAAHAGPVWLGQPAIAQLVQQALHFSDGRNYQLVCYCLMANHVHLVVCLPDNAPSLARTLQSLKGYTGRAANALLGRTGHFWQRESYDHVVRNGQELERVIAYVVNNPVKAGLTNDWQQWPYTYWAP
ncbi:transposase [Hymenobacter sp. H14-R3]|uniref:REP-associated tyrosine transposase n=1 Tax=Hymenobacter sp. H14-R3 TaxID=3046308 RepID=UPI0024BBE3D9|nr:transposase [Hymenobacter sp. H14-R3]MDJ0364630.1 transposase [Hymenobacter sp. H14-R3]